MELKLKKTPRGGLWVRSGGVNELDIVLDIFLVNLVLKIEPAFKWLQDYNWMNRMRLETLLAYIYISLRSQLDTTYEDNSDKMPNNIG